MVLILSENSSVSVNPSSTIENFWIRHRQYVIDRHYGKWIREAEVIADVGCRNGLFLAHCDRRFGKELDGFDLNLAVLQQVKAGRPILYNPIDRHPDFLGRYDLIFLLTVLEEIEDEVAFLTAVGEHLKPTGRLIVDLSMQSKLYSAVDRQLGRLRRYDTKDAIDLFQSAGLEIVEVVPWGHVYNGALRRRVDRTCDRAVENPMWVGKLSDGGDRLVGLIKYLDHVIPPFGMGSGGFFVLRG